MTQVYTTPAGDIDVEKYDRDHKDAQSAIEKAYKDSPILSTPVGDQTRKIRRSYPISPKGADRLAMKRDLHELGEIREHARIQVYIDVFRAQPDNSYMKPRLLNEICALQFTGYASMAEPLSAAIELLAPHVHPSFLHSARNCVDELRGTGAK